jgi:hypothetical protein
MSSGPLVLDTTGLTNVRESELQEFYTYETGHNNWNSYAAVVDMNGDYVVFDAPLQFLYTHRANDLNDDPTYDGEVPLNYGGPGDLGHSGAGRTSTTTVKDRWYPPSRFVAGRSLVRRAPSTWCARWRSSNRSSRTPPAAEASI